MSDNNPHHPGVRSLLAKFEGQSPVASPPSRGRSPASSDTSGTGRQLSKVRASFVTVDGVIQSNPASPLRKTSGHNDSAAIFGPKINSEAESSRQTMVSPTPVSRVEHPQNANLGQTLADGQPEQVDGSKGESEQPTTETSETPVETTPPLRDTPPKTAKDVSVESKSASPNTLSQRSNLLQTSKKPSPVSSARNTASKPKATPAPLALKSTTNTNSKPSPREVAKERANSLAHKPSTVSLNPKTNVRSPRGSIPAQESSKQLLASASIKSGVNSPTRSSHPPGSMAAPTKASSSKLGNTGAPSTRSSTSTTSTLHRKPSTQKSAVGSQSATDSAATGRKPATRPSLAAQPTNDTQTKPVNESFLARMMRPTASSASKLQTQEKADTKADTKPPAKSHKATRPSIGRVADRGASENKSKASTLRSQGDRSQPPNKGSAPQKNGPKPPRRKQESDKANVPVPIPTSPREPVPVSSTQPTNVEQPEKTIEETVALDRTDESIPEVSTPPAANELDDKPLETPKVSGTIVGEISAETSVDSIPVETSPVLSQAEAPATPINEVAENPETIVTDEAMDSIPALPKDTADEPATTSDFNTGDDVKIIDKQETVATEPGLAQASEPADLPVELPEKTETITEPPVELTKESSTEVKSEESAPAEHPSTEAESSNVALEIAHLALN